MLVLRLLNNYSRIPMSVVPSKLPKCTRTVVLDFLFMRKHSLSHSQMAVMYYLLLLKNWVTFKEDDYYVVLSKKIEKDLKLHPKTVEASITKLKRLNLIKTKRLIVKEWNNHKTFRAIGITELGKEYNLSHYKEDHYQHAIELEKENEAFRVENDKVHSKNMELELKSHDLELKNQALTIQLEADENINQEALKILEENQKLQKIKLMLEIENQELKERLELVEKGSIEEEKQKEKDIETFREKIIRQYARSGKAICNGVKNSDGWSIETKFYINGYSRLSIYLPNKKPKLIDQPRQVDNFWRWLFDHQHRVDNLINEKKPADISTLIPFIGALIVINKKSYHIKSFQPVIGGVKMTIFNDDSLINIGNGYGSDILDVVKCREWLERNSNLSF